MVKAVVFDVDGVITKSAYKFSNDFERNQGLDKGAMQVFFKGPFKKCTIGEADLKEELKPFLSKWKWDKSVDELIDLWFKTDGVVDNSILKLVSELRDHGLFCYIATNQEKYRARYFLEKLGFSNILDGHFISCNLGLKKPHSDFFKKILEELNLEGNEILFIDDSSENIEAAMGLGINTVNYKSYDLLIKELKKFNI